MLLLWSVSGYRVLNIEMEVNKVNAVFSEEKKCIFSEKRVYFETPLAQRLKTGPKSTI
jgi:hypothetical protein